MAPIYDTDIAEERWSQAEWESYELWEKAELRLKRRRRNWILATAGVFVFLFSVPIIADQRAKWATLKSARLLAQEINWVKREASIGHNALRIRFSGEGILKYDIESTPSCSTTAGSAPVLRTGTLSEDENFVLLTPQKGQELGVPGLVREFCYDAMTGSEPAAQGRPVVGFGIIPEKDLLESRMDRLSVLIITGPSADISFD
ncbi:MAG TPA: hypothetical protein VJB59_07340 [Bdellovibrionota bacterium]|nr:hypothetical protein [Bdellovibrionota bacterium]